MANSMLVYPLLLLALTAIAIYVQVSSSNLTLPISLGTTVLMILLPLIATANVFYTPLLHRSFSHESSPFWLQLSPAALQIIQAILTVVLATLSFQGVLPGQNLDCNLESTWKSLWSAHDGSSIARVQDAFNCCGLNSVKHMSWPSDPKIPNMCSQMYHRSSPCIVPWRAAMQRDSGLEFGVAAAVGIFQLVHLALFRLRNSTSASSRGYRRITQSVGAETEEALIGNGGEASSNTPGDRNESSTQNRQSYGASGHSASPRIEPSGLGDGYQWRI